MLKQMLLCIPLVVRFMCALARELESLANGIWAAPASRVLRNPEIPVC